MSGIKNTQSKINEIQTLQFSANRHKRRFVLNILVSPCPRSANPDTNKLFYILYHNEEKKDIQKIKNGTISSWPQHYDSALLVSAH